MKLSRKLDEFSVQVSDMNTIECFHTRHFNDLCLAEHLFGKTLFWHDDVSVAYCFNYDDNDYCSNNLHISLSGNGRISKMRMHQELHKSFQIC